MLYEVQLWGCVSALLGLPAELIPQMVCAVPDDMRYYTSWESGCQLFFANFLQQRTPQGGCSAGFGERGRAALQKIMR